MSGGVLKPAKSPSLSRAPCGVLSPLGADDGLQRSFQHIMTSAPRMPRLKLQALNRYTTSSRVTS